MRERYNQVVRDWDNFRQEYQTKRAENEQIHKMDALRNTLVMDGVRPDYTDLNSKDALKEYEHFVNTIKENKDNYTRDEWTAINVNWQALNGRKREIEKDIPSGDKSKIAKLQVEYTAIKAVNRPVAENP